MYRRYVDMMNQDAEQLMSKVHRVSAEMFGSSGIPLR
jgi:hypothetical protein